jgi:hypothetical protein
LKIWNKTRYKINPFKIIKNKIIINFFHQKHLAKSKGELKFFRGYQGIVNIGLKEIAYINPEEEQSMEFYLHLRLQIYRVRIFKKMKENLTHFILESKMKQDRNL